jgi:paraquat-inducible protein A
MAHDRSAAPLLTARAAGLIGCGRCGQVSRPGTERCPRCGFPVVAYSPASLTRVWAWWFAGLFAYIPANLYPMLQTQFLGRKTQSTIVGGVIDLIDHHAYFVAAVVFLASVMIPVAKFLAIGYLAWSVSRHAHLSQHTRTVLYEIVEFVGRWSMVDVFVVAILAALVNLGFVMSFRPGLAAVFFALSVAFTMVSALSLDPRLIWELTGSDGDDDRSDTVAS